MFYSLWFVCFTVQLCICYENYDELPTWTQFQDDYHKTYRNTAEKNYRKRIFESNLKRIKKHNLEYEQGKHTYTLGVNQFADLRTYDSEASQATTRTTASDTTLPDTVDWRTKGAVTAVKDQGLCASSWAFSTTGSLEGMFYLKQHKLISLSEQELIDCSHANDECDGGRPSVALRHVRDNGGIHTEKSYPYQGMEGICPDNFAHTNFRIAGYVSTEKSSEDSLKSAVANIGPVSVMIDASGFDFQFYKSGVYMNDHCPSAYLNHALLVVGYGTEDGREYWLLKNSFGTTWGDDGYFKMARNHHNMCGIADSAVYPVL